MMHRPDLYSGIRAAIDDGSASTTIPAWALGMLGDIADGRVAITAVRHPLGFLCLPVERRADHGVCLHLWSTDEPPVDLTTSGMHCHSWDLLSYVLYGRVRNTVLSIADDRPTHRVFEVVSHGEVDEIRATSHRVSYAIRGVAEYTAGQIYTLPAGVFHSTTIPDGRAAATVALGRTASDHDDLSLGPLDASTHHVRRHRCTPEETARAARRSLWHLAAGELR